MSNQSNQEQERTLDHLRQRLQTIATTEEPPSKRSLRLFSDLSAEEQTVFHEMWGYVPTERRAEVIDALRTIAEDNVDMDFRAVFHSCLDDPLPHVRATAIDGLWEDDRLLTLRRLLALANDPAQEVQVAALLNLARFAYMAELDELPVDEAAHMSNTLLDLAADMKQPLDVRRRAIEALGYFAEVSEAQAEIGRAYDSNSTQLRESALIAMGRSMRPEWFPLIEREMRSSSPELRFTAAQAAGELGEDGQQLVPALLALIDDDDTEVSTAAVWAMGQIGGAHGERVLERLLHSKNEVLRQAANEALSALRFYEP